MRLKIKNRSHTYDINRPRPRHGHEYIKYNMCHSLMMVIRIKQPLSNILSSVYEKVKQHWGRVEKSVAYKKSVYFEGRIIANFENSIFRILISSNINFKTSTLRMGIL